MVKKTMLCCSAAACAVALIVAAPLLAADKTGKAYLGILAAPAAENSPHAGVVVREVSPDSPAAKAGLKDGDVIMKAGNHEVKDVGALSEQVSQHKAGD